MGTPTFLKPSGSIGAAAKRLLEEAEIDVVTIYGEVDETPTVFDGMTAIPWKGINQIRQYINLVTEQRAVEV